jgi:hypothetical protein
MLSIVEEGFPFPLVGTLVYGDVNGFVIGVIVPGFLTLYEGFLGLFFGQRILSSQTLSTMPYGIQQASDLFKFAPSSKVHVAGCHDMHPFHSLHRQVGIGTTKLATESWQSLNSRIKH